MTLLTSIRKTEKLALSTLTDIINEKLFLCHRIIIFRPFLHVCGKVRKEQANRR